MDLSKVYLAPNENKPVNQNSATRQLLEWANTQRAINGQSGDYTIAVTDAGSIINCTGTGQTITLPAVTGFATGDRVFVLNSSTTRAQKLSGFPSDLRTRLYPLQACGVVLVNGAWKTLLNPGRWKPQSAPTVYLNPSGSDSANDGLATGSGNAYKTLAVAWGAIRSDIDTVGNAATISCDDGTYTISTQQILDGGYVGSHDINITGNVGTPSNVVFSFTSGGQLLITDFAIGILKGIKFTGGAINQIMMNNMGQGDISSCLFGTLGSGCSSLYLYGGAKLTVTGSNTFDLGSSGASWLLQGGASYADIGAGGACSHPMTLSGGFFNVTGPGQLQLDSITFTGNGAGTSSTGHTAVIQYNGIAQGIGGSTNIPGSGATTSNGGLIIS